MTLLTNLISYYKLDEPSGITATDSHGSNNGTNTGCTVNSTGKINTGYDWNANSDRVNLGGTIVSTTTAFSVSLWVNMDNVTNDGMLIGNGDNTNGFYIYNLGSGGWFNIREGATNHFTNENPGFTNGVYSHVVLTFDTSNYRLYIDGVLKLKEAATGVAANDNMRIGNWANDTLGGDMLIDEVGIWGKKLSDTIDTVGQSADGEVAELFNSGNGLAYPFTTGWDNKIFGIVPGKVQGIDAANISKIQGLA